VAVEVLLPHPMMQQTAPCLAVLAVAVNRGLAEQPLVRQEHQGKVMPVEATAVLIQPRSLLAVVAVQAQWAATELLTLRPVLAVQVQHQQLLVLR
jgi:hypothetical protein